MIKYCKAYPIQTLRAFDGWAEKIPVGEAVAPENGETPAEPAEPFLYLHDSYIVTDGIFADEKVVFDEVTPEWTEFCKNNLKFEPPSYELPVNPEQPSSNAVAG